MTCRFSHLVRRVAQGPLFGRDAKRGIRPMSRADEVEAAELHRRREQRRREREGRP